MYICVDSSQNCSEAWVILPLGMYLEMHSQFSNAAAGQSSPRGLCQPSQEAGDDVGGTGALHGAEVTHPVTDTQAGLAA